MDIPGIIEAPAPWPPRKDETNRIRALENALIGVKKGSCWCGKAIDNPMIKNHSESCQRAAQVLKGETTEDG